MCFQDFDAEIADLPGVYAPPHGQMLFLRDPADNALVGCVAVRPVPDVPGMCEMKRLYLRPAARGHRPRPPSRRGRDGRGAAAGLPAHVPGYAAQAGGSANALSLAWISPGRARPGPILLSCFTSGTSRFHERRPRAGPAHASAGRPHAGVLRLRRAGRHARRLPARHAGFTASDRVCPRGLPRTGRGTDRPGPLGIWAERGAARCGPQHLCRRHGGSDGSPRPRAILHRRRIGGCARTPPLLPPVLCPACSPSPS